MALSRTAAAAAALLVVASVPALGQQRSPGAPTQAPGAPPQGDQLSDAMVRKVGTALRHVATIRQQYSQRAQSANSQQQRQDLNDQAQKDMMKAIDAQGLSVAQYDQAIQMAQADPSLRERLLKAAQSAD
jgi:hypothetical protein